MQDAQQRALVFVSDMTSPCKIGAICWCGQEPTCLLGFSMQNIQTPPWMLCCGIPLLVARPASELNRSKELLNFRWSQWGILYKIQQFLCIGWKESKPYTSPSRGWSGRFSGCFGHWSPLWRTSGFPDLSTSRRKGCPLQLGHPSSGTFLWGGRSKVRSLRAEDKNQTLGSLGLGQWPKRNMTLSLPSSNISTEASQQLHLNWLKMSQNAFSPSINFVRYHEELLPTHVEFAFKSKDSWARQNTAFWQSSF